MKSELTTTQPAQLPAETKSTAHGPMTYSEAMQLGHVMYESGLFPDMKSAAQCVVKILAGAELGFGPFASMSGIHIVKGKAEPGANLLAVCVKRSGRYDYRVLELTPTACELVFFEHGKESGRSRFTIEDARKAGTQNLDKFPRNMLFARAMSNGIKWHCPDAENGVTAYSQGELDEGQTIPTYTPPEPEQTPAPRNQGGQHASPPPDGPRGNGGKVPLTGKGLYDALCKKDRELSSQGVIEKGQLLSYAEAHGKQAGFAGPISSWKHGEAKVVGALCQTWIAEQQTAADATAAQEQPEEGYAGQEVEEPSPA